jgi:hemolysin activation/secretion protein
MGNYVGKRGLMFLGSAWNGRLESGSLADSLLSGEARYYLRFNDKNVFTAAIEGQHGFDLDVDHQLLLGGDTGLRGYPLRYQAGDTLALMSVEERYYTDWFPFRLVRVGAAVFADVGRTWGTAPLASEPQGWLSDVGFGLRLGNARSGLGNVLHMDLAFPLGASSDISSVQVLLEAQKSF